MGLFFGSMSKKPIEGVEGHNNDRDKLRGRDSEEHINPRIDAETGLPKYGSMTNAEVDRALHKVRRELGDEAAQVMSALAFGARDDDHGSSPKGIDRREYGEILEELETNSRRYDFDAEKIARVKKIFNDHF